MTGNESWFNSKAGQQLASVATQRIAPLLWPLCGHNALVLQPCAQGLPLPALQCQPVIQLQRASTRFYGDIISDDAPLPFPNECMALVHAAFVLETSPNPNALLAEFTRLLLPEAHVSLLALNPYCPFRWSGAWRGLSLESGAFWTELLVKHGLEPLSVKALGAELVPPALRSVNFILARKRKSALTPLRTTANAVALARNSHPL